MKTKITQKIIIMASVMMLISNFILAQGLYINVGLGYNLASGKDVLATNQTSSTEENVYGSYGEGLNFGAIFGYMFSANVGGELGFSYLSGKEFTSTFNTSNTNITQKVSGTMLRLTPALKVTAGEKIKPYGKFGLVLGLSPGAELTATGATSGSTYQETDKYSGGTSMGWMGAFGVDIELSGNMSIFGELTVINQSWAPDKNEWTITSSSGSVSITESGTTTYVDKVVYPVAESPVYDVDLQQLRDPEPFSSFGINVGVMIAFGK